MEVYFCDNCGNHCSIYENIEEKTLYLGCKSCGSRKEYTTSCIYNNEYSIDLSKSISENPHLNYDVTLPEIKNNSKIKCSNPECSNPNDILYVKYDEANMSYLYQCKNCKQSWTNK